MEREVAWKKYDEAASSEVEALAADYIDFISDNKTERECAAAAIAAAEDAGYDSLADCIAARELIKIKVLENSEYDAREAADILCEAIHAECVQVIGRKFVLFRKKPKESAYAELLKK